MYIKIVLHGKDSINGIINGKFILLREIKNENIQFKPLLIYFKGKSNFEDILKVPISF